MRNVSFGGVIYLIIGVVIAVNRGYLVDLSTLGHIASAAAAIALWPLLFFGANLHLTF